MKTNASEEKPIYRGFYDFTMFSVVPVQPGAILTPAGALVPYRIIPLRKRHRSCQSGWDTSKTYYIQYTPPTKTKQMDESGGAEEGQWTASARRARMSWMDENPY